MLSSVAFAAVATHVVKPALRDVDLRALEVIQQAQQGSSAAFAEYYDRYVDRVFAFIQRRVGDRHLAEDLTADVFTRALKRLNTYSFNGTDPIAWLLTIARNRVHDHFRSGRFRLEHLSDDAGSHSTQVSDGAELTAERRAIVDEVQLALTKIKPDHAEVLHLRFIEDLTVAETAEILGRKVGAIRALQHRALKSLSAHVDLTAVAS